MSILPKLFAVCFLFSLCSSNFYAQAKKPVGGLLWKISGKGLEKPSYLLGTWHGSSAILYGYVDSIPGYHSAFDACTQLVGEVQMTAPSNSLTANISMIKMPADTTYADLLNEQEYHFLDSVTQHVLEAPLNQVYLRPTLLSLMLHKFIEIKTFKEKGYSQSQIDSLSQVMDFVIENKAKEKGYTLEGLETLEEQLNGIRGLWGATDLKEQAIQMVKDMQASEEQKAAFEALGTRLAKIYRSQDIARFVDYEIYADSVIRNFTANSAVSMYIQDDLMTQRNLNWMKKLPILMQKAPTFIAVGVRHLPGKNGLLTLLRKKGYRVEAVKN